MEDVNLGEMMFKRELDGGQDKKDALNIIMEQIGFVGREAKKS